MSQIDRKVVRANYMATYEFLGYGYKFTSELLASIEKIRLDDVNQYIKRYLLPDNAYLSIVGKK